jgi:hypothetical protein
LDPAFEKGLPLTRREIIGIGIVDVRPAHSEAAPAAPSTPARAAATTAAPGSAEPSDSVVLGGVL